ncbi:hypothetical protein BGX24_007562 [Mortierella sp. AD032]|nr:hypothetical protein BGX24_007562 [Mortierella sp. AD032]
MPNNAPTTTPNSNSKSHANQEDEATAASILLQDIYAQSDPFKTIAHYIVKIHSKIDGMALQICQNNKSIGNLALTVLEHSRRLSQLPPPSLNDTTTAIATVAPAPDPAVSNMDSNSIYLSVNDLDEMNKQIEHNSQGFLDLNFWVNELAVKLNDLAASVKTTAAISEDIDDGGEDDEDCGLARGLEGEQQDPVESEQDDNAGITNTEFEKDEMHRDKGKHKSREYGECEDGALKKEQEEEEEVEEMVMSEYLQVQPERHEEDDMCNRVEPGGDEMASPVNSTPPPRSICLEQDLCDLFDQVASLYNQPTPASTKELASHYKFSASMPKTLDEIWNLWFVSKDKHPSIWSLDTMVDNWRFRYSSGQVINYHRQNAVILNVLEQLYHINHDGGYHTSITSSNNNNTIATNNTNAASTTFKGYVAIAMALVEAEINDAGSMVKYAIGQYKEQCLRRGNRRSSGPYAKRPRI